MTEIPWIGVSVGTGVAPRELSRYLWLRFTSVGVGLNQQPVRIPLQVYYTTKRALVVHGETPSFRRDARGHRVLMFLYSREMSIGISQYLGMPDEPEMRLLKSEFSFG